MKVSKLNILAIVGILAILGFPVLNYTSVQNLVTELRAEYEVRQKESILANWETHFRSEIARLEDQARNYSEKLYELRVDAKKDEIELRRLREDYEEADALALALAREIRANEGGTGFMFLNRQFTLEEANRQLSSFSQEIHGLKMQIQAREEVLEAKLTEIERLQDVIVAFRESISEIQLKGEQLAYQKTVRDIEAETQKIQDLIGMLRTGEGVGSLRSLEQTLTVLEEYLLEQEAKDELRVTEEATGVITLQEARRTTERKSLREEAEDLATDYLERAEKE